MRRKTIKKRRFMRYFSSIIFIFKGIMSHPMIRTVILVTIVTFTLLVPVPYLLTKITSEAPKDNGALEKNTDFEPAEIPDTIKVYRTAGKKTESVNFEEYVKGVVSGEMPSNFQLEALKAQSVAARTYSLARVINAEKNGNPKAHPSAPLCDSTHCQVYKNKQELKKSKGEAWMKDGWKKISKAADSTKGELLYYDGKLVEQALFHSSSGGKTEDCQDVFASAVPYLVSVESPYEDNATHQNEKNSFSINEFSNKLKNKYPSISFGDINASNIEIVNRSKGGRVEKMKIGNGVIEGRSVREALGLPSANFTINISKNTITFTSNGSGHGVGMSQYGADGMAKKGYDYKKILSHYYSGTVVR